MTTLSIAFRRHPAHGNELVASILDHLYFDKDTLLNCALVSKAWVPSQLRIFRRIVIEPPEALACLERYYVKSRVGIIP